MNKKIILLLFVSIFLIGIVSASATWDNKEKFVNDTNSKYGKYEVYDSWFLGIGYGNKLMELELKNNTDVCSQDCMAISNVTLTEQGSLVDDIKFKTLQEDGSWKEQPIRSYQFFYLNGSNWIEYTLGTEMPIGTYKVKLEGKKKPSRTVDWVINSQGIWTDNWAVWGGDYIIIIRANSLNENVFNTSETYIENTGINTWTLHGNNSNYEIGRAKVMELLFRDRTIITDVTNVTELRTNDNRDINASAYYISFRFDTTASSNRYRYYSGTFSNTTGNNVSSWWKNTFNGINPNYYYKNPTSTFRSHNIDVDNFGTNQTGNQTINPDGWKIQVGQQNNPGSNNVGYGELLLISKKSTNITTGGSGGINTLYYNISYYEDYSIPKFSSLNLIELNSPTNNYISPTSQVTFNASAEIVDGASIINMSLWDNSTGTWGLNQTFYRNYFFDDFEDGSVNNSKWTVTTNSASGGASSVVETSGYQRIYSYALAATTGSYGEAISDSINVWEGDNNYLILYYNLTYRNDNTPAPPNRNTKIKLGSTTIKDITGYPGGIGTYDKAGAIIEFYYNQSDDKVYYNYNNTGWVQTTETNSSELEFYSKTSRTGSGYGGWTRLKIYYVRDGYTSDGNNINMTRFTNPITWTNKTISDTTLWTVQACDSDGDCGFANENRTVFLDASPPIINITYPNGTINEGTIGNETLNWTISDAQGNLDSCWYDYNGTNVSVNCNSNTTTFSLENQNFNLTMYANDTLGNLASQTTTWNYNFIILNQTYNDPVTEGSTQNYKLWLQSNQGISLIELIYDGTSYSRSFTDHGSFLFELDASNITIPSVTSNSTKQFYWNITLADSSIYQTTNNTQTVLNLGIDNCSSYNNTLFNYTMYDEETLNKLSGTGYNTSLETSVKIYPISDYGGTPVIQFNESKFQENPTAICLESNLSSDIYYMDVITTYTANGYNLEYYYIQKGTLNSSSMNNNIDLYLLNSSQSTLTVLRTEDTAQQPVNNIIIQIQRYDISSDTFYTVGMAKTSVNGEDVVYLNWYDTLYKFILLQDNNVVKSTDPYKISETPQIFTIGTSTEFTWMKFNDFQYSLYYNNVTQNFVLTFVKPSAQVDKACLRVTKRSYSNDTEICNTCETSSSATLYCNIASSGNGTYIASFLAYGSFDVIDWITEKIGGGFSSTINSAIGNEDATFYAFIFSGIVMAMFFITPILGIIGLLIGILGAAALGFILINYIEYLGITIVGLIIIWLIKR